VAEEVIFYHVAQRSDVPAMRQGISPPGDPAVADLLHQYGRGFYVFREYRDAARYKRIRERQVLTEWVIVEIRLTAEEWAALKRRVVPLVWDDAGRVKWGVPAAVEPDWLTQYDVLAGLWGVTEDTRDLAGAWQIKFNPHTYGLLRVGQEVD
jgi:hypothetical protein